MQRITNDYTDLQSQKAVSAYFTSKQILPFGVTSKQILRFCYAGQYMYIISCLCV